MLGTNEGLERPCTEASAGEESLDLLAVALLGLRPESGGYVNERVALDVVGSLVCLRKRVVNLRVHSLFNGHRENFNSFFASLRPICLTRLAGPLPLFELSLIASSKVWSLQTELWVSWGLGKYVRKSRLEM